MSRRRLELAGPRAPQLASSMARSMSLGSVFAAGSAALAGAYMLTRPGDRLAAARRRFARRDLMPARPSRSSHRHARHLRPESGTLAAGPP
jgi:hypothetical protein